MTRFYLLLLVTILTFQAAIATAVCKDCHRDVQLSLAESQDDNVSLISSVPQGSPVPSPSSSVELPISPGSSLPASSPSPNTVSSSPPSTVSSPAPNQVLVSPTPLNALSPPLLTSPPTTFPSFTVPQTPFTPKSSPAPKSSEPALPSLPPISSTFPGSKSLFPPLPPLLSTPPSSPVTTLAPPPLSPPVRPRQPPAPTLVPPALATPPSSPVPPRVSPPVLSLPPPSRSIPPPTSSLAPPPASTLVPPSPIPPILFTPPPSSISVPPPSSPHKALPPSSPPPTILPLPALPPFGSPPVLPLPALPPLSPLPPLFPLPASPPMTSLPPKSAPPIPVPSVTPPPTVTPTPAPSRNNSLPTSPPPSESNSPRVPPVTPPPTDSPPPESKSPPVTSAPRSSPSPPTRSPTPVPSTLKNSPPPESNSPAPKSSQPPESHSPQVSPGTTPPTSPRPSQHNSSKVPPPDSSVLPSPSSSAPTSPPSVPIHNKTPAPAVLHFSPLQSPSRGDSPLAAPLASPVPPPFSTTPQTRTPKDNSTAPSPQTRPPPKDNSTTASPSPTLSPAASPRTSATPPPVSPPPTAPQPPTGITPPPTMTELAQPPAMVFAPPPNAGCHKVCAAPAVTTLPGMPCGCVIPMSVGLQLKIPISTFLSLVSELAEELARGTYLLKQQVQIVGAGASGQDFADTSVKASLVPLGNSFTNETAFRIASRLWLHQVSLDETLFVNYTVLYIIYPGLPTFSSQNVVGSNRLPPIDGGQTEQPLGVNVHKNKNHKKLQPGVIAVIALGCMLLVTVSLAVALFFIARKHRLHSDLSEEAALGSSSKRSITANLLSSSSPESAVSLASSFIQFTSSVRTLSLAEIIKATDKFDPSHVIGEGGFGRVYSGVLDDGTKIAVKVLIREDQQGDREFAAEVEMLSRLHHRNLVKLVGICTEDEMRCLVYELIPNGSVESHLHGEDKERSPLSWEARMKIALGAARALAYLHEDSYPRVIHRDFKSSNILLEHDFTPKVSDFGLAKAASEELTGHISTRVMGTFGYVAPEYAMTGHLLVKSDVYSYGVVLLELLSGRKPVDMLRPAGQENLVTWARPLLTSLEGLGILVEPELKKSIPIENLARVAAIASMCVQPEVSQRPFMSEVVQALKLVCNESDGDSGGETSNNKDKDYYEGQEWDTLSLITSDSSGAAHQQYNRTLSASIVLPSWVPPCSGRHSAPETNYRTNNGPLRVSRSDHEIAKCHKDRR